MAQRDNPKHQFRAGGRVLSLFASTRHGAILRARTEGEISLSALRERLGEPSVKALRGNIGNLIGLGALEKRRPGEDPDLFDNELTSFGESLISAAGALEAWLGRAPGAPLELEEDAGKTAIKALIGGWNSAIVRVLAAHPLSLRELDGLIASFSFAALERRLRAMEEVGLLSAAPAGEGAGDTVYSVTGWLRESTAPLLTAIYCERLFLADSTAPLNRLDIEALGLLAVPLLGRLGSVDGACRLLADLDGDQSAPAGVTVKVEEGKISSCVAKLDPAAASWARGSTGDWLFAIFDGGVKRLEMSDGDELPLALVTGLRRSFAAAGAPLG